ncbi:MAG: response regulator [Candidatus Aminicenantes bacterium]|nr:response regulator [Candidatus Aminicenantes bacterium]NIN21016.1 response regulator [Candidatus Aminicenantes bacterium]NIN44837.1 response regulator [Candidatus Aminicenantes bacterium]NIN87645.1 response regulator [Candidatus Aminicenantes bacterium]NIO87387.1 response regulator [Candidatus Aminicenantes bacterium]
MVDKQGVTILIMEDELATRKSFALFLESKGFRVMEAENGQIGLELFREEKPHLILLDLRMPVVNGLEVLSTVTKESPETPVIVISGTEKIADAVEALHLGAWDYVLKPIQDMSVLFHSVEKVRERVRLIQENKRYHEHLEAEIEKRTKELILANQQLTREIKERERAEAERKEAEEKERLHRQQLIQADKMASLGVLVSGVAHEINNPNNFIMVNTPILTKIWKTVDPILNDHYQSRGDFYIAPRIKYSEMKENIPGIISGILEGAQRIDNFVRELKNFARPTPSTIDTKIDINKVIQASVTLLANLIKKSTNRFYTNYGENIPEIKGNFQRLEQVIINLLENSCQALQSKDQGIVVSTQFDPGSKMVKIQVKDEGVGMTPETLEIIKNPFFTTKRSSGGTGLGLSISSKIIEDHQGTLEFESNPGGGTTAAVLLPVEPGPLHQYPDRPDKKEE